LEKISGGDGALTICAGNGELVEPLI